MTTKSLMVRVGADIKDMERGLKSARAKMKAFGNQIKKIGKVMAVAGTAVVGAVGLMVRNYIKAGDAVHKMALRTGFSTEALSELKYAAEISGASLEALEKGVKKMSKTIVDASDGLTTYVRAFERIGLEVEELMTLSPEKQFDKIARAIASIESPTIRAATAQEIFGRAGTQLLPLFAAGEEGLEKLRKKAHELGIVFDQEAADKAARLTDALTTLKGSITGVSMGIAEKLIPALSILVEGFADTIKDIKFGGKDMTTALLDSFKFIIKGVTGVMMAFHVLKLATFKVTEGVSGYARKYLEATAKVDKAISEQIPWLGKLLMKFGSTEEAIDTLTITEGTYRTKAEETINTLTNLVVFIEKLEASLDKAAESYRNVVVEATKLPEVFLETLPPMKEFFDVALATIPLYERLQFASSAYAKTLNKMSEEVGITLETVGEVWNRVVQNMGESLMNWGEMTGNILKNVSKIFSTFIGETIKGIGRLVIAELLAAKKEMLIAKTKSIAKAIASVFSKVPFPLNVALAGTMFGVVGALFAKLPIFKEGGYVPKETLAHLHPGEYVLSAPTVKALTSPTREVRTETFSFSPTVIINTKSLDDYTINKAAEKIFASMEREKRRRGL